MFKDAGGWVVCALCSAPPLPPTSPITPTGTGTHKHTHIMHHAAVGMEGRQGLMPADRETRRKARCSCWHRPPHTTGPVCAARQAEGGGLSGPGHWRHQVSLGRSATQGEGVYPQTPQISWSGAGIFFFWQLGAMKYLAERYDLSKVPMAGASGGALAAVLAVCKVDAAAALQKAHIMSMEHRIYQKPMSFFGAWGGFIEQVCVGSSVSRRTSSPAAAVCSTSFATRSGWTSCYRTMRRSCAEGRSTS